MRRTLAALLVATAVPAIAQRADDNATTAADDAFGKSVGDERVGIYNPSDVRGFSPVAAGNVRIEGLYFDQQSSLSSRLVDGSTIRVGLAAQSYPFPAPTGIADYQLRRAGERTIISPVVGYGPFGGGYAQLDTQIALVPGELSLVAGADIIREHTVYGGRQHYWSFALAPRWQPTKGLEIIPFYSRLRFTGEENQPLVFTAGAYLPPKIRRKNYYGQPWATNRGANSSYGTIVNAATGPWSLRAGLFRSVADQDRTFSLLFTGVTPDGRGEEIVVARPPALFASTSGELRVSRRLDEGPRRHVLTAAFRAREQRRLFGGEQVLDLGPTVIGVADPVPKPDFTFGERSRDRIRQFTAGLAYELRWRDLGELSVGIQKTRYQKAGTRPGGPLPTSKDSPWLLNATAAAILSSDVVVYAGYTRGLEESPTAPDIATNRNEAPPAIETKQVDAGVRWAIRPDLKLVAGVFEVRKPFFDLDAAGRFGPFGAVTNRGVELSLAGTLAPGVSLVAGTVFLRPRVSGDAVDRGLIGKKPVAAIERTSFGSLNWQIGQSPVSLDAVVEATGDRIGNQQNSFTVPPRAVLALGGRYRFKVMEKPATLRVQAGNVFNNYGFGIGGGGLIVYNAPRRLLATLAADL